MTMLTEKELEQIKNNAAVLERLTDMQVIMLALSALVMEADKMPPGTRFSLHTALRSRTGLKDYLA